MKKISFLLVFIFSFQILNAQFGISAGYKPIQAKNWEQVIAQYKLSVPTNYEVLPLSNGVQLGVDYWFRLKNYRVEFLPELSYTRFTRIWAKVEGNNDRINSNFLGLHFNTNFYIFNFKGDCDCPTWSKEGPSLKKGFFIQLAPGVDYVFNSFKQEKNTKTVHDIVPSVGIGIGVDIGLSDLLTITPMVKIHHYFDVEWEGLNTFFETQQQPISPELNKNDITQLFAGIRIGLRLDKQ